ncbi:aminotransferase [Salmonella enterica subsp. enterica]|uniref:Aminotransferase n=1 Tax=Salmonella enterica I TaxID=59201 RepID=A0A3S4I097_SALET|nr:aminotransferase [Salmonella enterica subsp. enterica]
MNRRQSTFPGQELSRRREPIYYGWIVKKLGLDDEQLKWVMADVAGIAPSMGSGFGPAGSGFIRFKSGMSTYLP